MTPTVLVVLVVGALAVRAVGTRLRLPAPLLLLLVGLGVSFLPGLPDFHLEPEAMLALVLPPLVYSAALDSSYVNIRAVLRPIGLFSVGLVVVTTAAVGVTAHLVLPQFPIASAIVLGALVAPTDAVAAMAICRRLNVPRRAMALLAGESLGNDAAALTLWKLAVAVAMGAALSWWQGILLFLYAAAVGGLVGAVTGYVVHRIRLHIGDGVLESAIGVATPFACYALAEQANASGVLAVAMAGVLMGHKAPYGRHTTRLQENAVWRSVDVLLESVVFTLIGLQLPTIVASAGVSWPLVGAAGVLLAVTVLVRLAWVFPVAYLPLLRSRGQPPPDPKATAVVGWAGMRGVISLAVAYATPESMPGRDLVLLFTFAITVGTLLLHGSTLAGLIRLLDVPADEAREDADDEAKVRHEAVAAATEELDRQVAADDERTPEHVVGLLRSLAEHRQGTAREWMEDQADGRAEAFQRLFSTMLDIERKVFVAARDSGEIDDEVLRRVLHELDLRQASVDTT
ncbi:sodium:proton antiporter [Kutzneria sp. 744]|uniref:cation:proton antiporter n=1 Tax=Kutzneria sp. (strain 744) TaxID=345341 RepID=UPI0003EEC0C3|nr:sodium:proton antiporter [Kutzneria sp. 744]EWM18703.1 Na+/H+ antiporter [Kutzneria sp. 744]